MGGGGGEGDIADSSSSSSSFLVRFCGGKRGLFFSSLLSFLSFYLSGDHNSMPAKSLFFSFLPNFQRLSLLLLLLLVVHLSFFLSFGFSIFSSPFSSPLLSSPGINLSSFAVPLWQEKKDLWRKETPLKEKEREKRNGGFVPALSNSCH
jgi:hypothetical protein